MSKELSGECKDEDVENERKRILGQPQELLNSSILIKELIKVTLSTVQHKLAHCYPRACHWYLGFTVLLWDLFIFPSVMEEILLSEDSGPYLTYKHSLLYCFLDIF